jgi:hypothetical protein
MLCQEFSSTVFPYWPRWVGGMLCQGISDAMIPRSRSFLRRMKKMSAKVIPPNMLRIAIVPRAIAAIMPPERADEEVVAAARLEVGADEDEEEWIIEVGVLIDEEVLIEE